MAQKVLTIGVTGLLQEATNAAEEAGYQPQPPNSVSKEMTGFADPSAITSSYNSTNRTFTLTGTVSAYWQGVAVPALTSGWVSPAHAATNGPWFLFYDGANYVWQQTLWTFDMLMIGYAYYGVSDKFGIREVHGLMPWYVHEEFHRTNGTYLESGGDLSGYTLNSTTIAERRPAVSTTIVHDEDIQSAITALADGGPYTVLNLTSTGNSTFTTGSAEIVPVSGSHPYYNQFSTPNWVQTLMSNNSYMTVWLVAVPTSADNGSLPYRYLWVQGQSNGPLADEQGKSFGSMNLGQLSAIFTEFVVVAKLILKYQGGDWTIKEVAKVTGTKLSQSSAPAGNYLSAVSVAAPLTGSGTPASPITAPQYAGSTAGLVPAGAGSTTKYLREDGTWGIPPGSGGGATPTTTSGTTASLAAGSTGNVEVTMPIVGTIMKVETDYPAWVRLYTLGSWRTADASRPITDDPIAGEGVVLDVLTEAGNLTIYTEPAPIFVNTDVVTPYTGYLAVTNKDYVSRAITVTITYLPMAT